MKQSKSVITEDFEVIFNSVMAEVSRKIRCNTLARVIAVNDKLLSVQPIIQEKINTPTDIKYLKLPVIHNVYCIAGQTPNVGDYVACLHFDRGIGEFDLFNNLDGFIESGSHRHDLTDCVAVVLNTKSNAEERLGEFSGSTNVPQIKDCAEIRIVFLENAEQIGSTVFYRIDGTNINIKLPQDTQSITIDLDSGDIVVPQNYSIVIYTKK